MKRVILALAILMLTYAASTNEQVLAANLRLPGDPKEDDALQESATVFSMDSSNVELVGREPFGPAYAVYAVNNYTYLCAGGTLVILDVSDPLNPVEAGRINTPGAALGIHVVGGTAYIADGWAGLYVIDVSNPTNPQVVGHCSDPHYATGVHIVGETAYVTDDWAGLYVIDVSNPSNPQVVGFCDTIYYATGVYVIGNYAYVADEDGGLRVIDVSNPSDPHEVGFCDTIYYATGVYVVGETAYVACRWNGLYVVNVSNPTNPQVVGQCEDLHEAMGVHVVGETAYVACRWNGLYVVDVSNPTNPQVVGQCEDPDDAVGVYVVGSYGYVPCEREGLRVIVVSDPTNPHEVGRYDTPDDAVGVYVVGETAYVVYHRYGLRVIDVSNPSDPHAVGYCDTPGRAEGVHVVGKTAYVADERDGLYVIDVSNPTNPHVVGQCEDPDNAVGVYVVGSYGYVANGWAGLSVIVVSDPTNPHEVGYYDTPGWAVGVHVVGNYAYVADEDGGLRVIDVSDPLNPYEVGYYDAPARAQGIHVVGETAYVADEQVGLWVVDVSDPTNPGLVGLYPTYDANEVHVSKGYGYVANGWHGLSIINVSDPKQLEEIGFYDTPGSARGVHMAGNHVYIADGYSGLCILRYVGPDYAAPAPVTDLSAVPSLTADNKIELEWTAPGDDWDSGTASAYIVRYNTAPITESNWGESSDVGGEPTPGPAGSVEGMTVTVPYPGITHYFALKTQDEVPNTSGISNSPWANTGAAIYLHKGWNLVAFMGSIVVPVEEAMLSVSGKYSSIWGYDGSTGNWLRHIVGVPDFLNNLHELGPGYGYWIYTTEVCTWRLGGDSVPAPPAAAMRKPPFVLYGKLTRDGRPITSSHAYNVSLKVGGAEVASYTIGSNPHYRDYYVLEIPVDGSFHKGDAAQIYVEGVPAKESPINLGEIGIMRQHDISYLRPPKTTQLLQNYPNPFNPETWIPYQLIGDTEVVIRIYSLTGQLIRKLDLGYKPAGHYLDKDRAAYWDGYDNSGEPTASDVYFYTLHAGSFRAAKKMVIAR